MNSSVNWDRVNLRQSLPTIAQQQIPVQEGTPVYMFFYQRREAATRYLTLELSEVAREEFLVYIEYCNEQIKKYLAL
jgi:hypothetical protein